MDEICVNHWKMHQPLKIVSTAENYINRLKLYQSLKTASTIENTVRPFNLDWFIGENSRKTNPNYTDTL